MRGDGHELVAGPYRLSQLFDEAILVCLVAAFVQADTGVLHAASDKARQRMAAGTNLSQASAMRSGQQTPRTSASADLLVGPTLLRQEMVDVAVLAGSDIEALDPVQLLCGLVHEDDPAFAVGHNDALGDLAERRLALGRERRRVGASRGYALLGQAGFGMAAICEKAPQA